MKIHPSPEAVHTQLIRARHYRPRLDTIFYDDPDNDVTDTGYYFAQGVLAAIEWLINNGPQPLTAECEWEP